MGLRRLFTEHPESVGETYLQHATVATGFGLRMLFGGFACLLHAIFPFAFRHTGSECITELHERMVMHRAAAARAHGSAQPAKVTPFDGGNVAVSRKNRLRFFPMG
jgi:hypothetical protein